MIRLWGNKMDCIGDSKQETPRLCWKLIGISGAYVPTIYIYMYILFFLRESPFAEGFRGSATC